MGPATSQTAGGLDSAHSSLLSRPCSIRFDRLPSLAGYAFRRLPTGGGSPALWKMPGCAILAPASASMRPIHAVHAEPRPRRGGYRIVSPYPTTLADGVRIPEEPAAQARTDSLVPRRSLPLYDWQCVHSGGEPGETPTNPPRAPWRPRTRHQRAPALGPSTTGLIVTKCRRTATTSTGI